MIIDLPNQMSLRAAFHVVKARAEYLGESQDSLRRALKVVLSEMQSGRSAAASVALALSLFKSIRQQAVPG